MDDEEDPHTADEKANKKPHMDDEEDPHTADDEDRKPTKKPHMDDEEDSPEVHEKTHTRLMMRKANKKTTHG